jgi:hypothetical protein
MPLPQNEVGKLHLFVVKYSKIFATKLDGGDIIIIRQSHYFNTVMSAKAALTYEVSSSGLILN